MLAAGLFTLFLLGGFAGGLPRLILACEPAPANMRLLKQNIKTRRAAGKARIGCFQLRSVLSLMIACLQHIVHSRRKVQENRQWS